MFVHISSLSLAAALTAVSLFTFTGEASAATSCGNHDDVAKALTSNYDETRHIMGVVSDQMVMEIYISPKGTWTVLVTDTSGTTCITASGEDWQNLPATVAGLDS
jgi:hypothetical protein